jgi:hypothetical protein
VSVRDRIQQLETLVRSLVQQQQTSQASTVLPEGLMPDSSTHHSQDTPQDVSPTRPAPVDGHASSHSWGHAAFPVPSESGSIHLHSQGAKYVGSVHWAAVLDSISELRDHYEEEEEARILATSDSMPRPSPGPRLLYEPVQATKADLLASIPPRPVVDRMVARYFNAQGLAPAILHSGCFLREVRACVCLCSSRCLSVSS